MITKEGRLLIFEQFKIDRHLPKFNKTRKKGPPGSALSKSMDMSGGLSLDEDEGEDNMSKEEWEAGRIRFTASGLLVREDTRFNITSTTGEVSVLPSSMLSVPPTTRPWYSRLVSWFQREPPPEAGALSPVAEPAPSLTIEEFFGEVKNSAEEIRLVHERLRGYQQALEDARATGQRALCERLAVDIEAVRAETQLHAIGLSKYLDEAPIVRFYKDSPRGLRLDWVANFLRVVPADIRDRKIRCDELGIFDNYAVLHYDPDTSSYAQTQAEIQAEIAAKRDPILFGLIQGRRRLYYIGDWIDETCDLTLEQIADRLGSIVWSLDPQPDPGVRQITPEWQP